MSWRTCRAASRNGSDSMSPTVPPISVITTSTLVADAHGQDPVLDLVGDVRDHLDGVAEVVAAALLGDHAGVDLAGGHVGDLAEVGVEEPLVVPDVEVGLGAVVGDEHLAVLERVHRPGVDVEVGVQLLHRHAQPARLQQAAEAGGREALPEGGGDASGDEHVLGRRRMLHGVPSYPSGYGSVRTRRTEGAADSVQRADQGQHGGHLAEPVLGAVDGRDRRRQRRGPQRGQVAGVAGVGVADRRRRPTRAAGEAGQQARRARRRRRRRRARPARAAPAAASPFGADAAPRRPWLWRIG